MKNIIKVISLCLVIVLFVSVLSSCGNKGKFVGTWKEIDSDGEESGEKLVLANDGTGSVTDDGASGSVRWSLKDDKLFLTISMCGMTETMECTYEFSGDRMILTNDDGDVTIYRRVSSK